MRRIWPPLVGALVLLAVAAFATLGLRWVRMQRSLREKLTARDAIHEQVRGILLNQGVLKMAARFGSSPGNLELARCILAHEPDAPLCRVTSAAEQMSFSLPEAQGPDAPIVVGDTERPAPYSSSGALGCAEGVPNCPGWIVTAWFWADCPQAAAECEQAEAVHVRYIVQGIGAMAAMASNPTEESFQASPEAFAELVKIEQGGAP